MKTEYADRPSELAVEDAMRNGGAMPMPSKVRIEFPFTIRQVDKMSVEIEMVPFNGPFFATDVLSSLAPGLSDDAHDELADRIVRYARTEAIRAMIKVR